MKTAAETVTVSDGAGIIDIRQPRRLELVPALRIALATGQIRRPLRETLRPLLDQLADGRYELSGPERLPEPAELVPTGEWPSADSARVAYYRKAIRRGHKPVAVLVRSFVVDGHHKIAAYRAEGVTPVVVRISYAYSDS